MRKLAWVVLIEIVLVIIILFSNYGGVELSVKELSQNGEEYLGKKVTVEGYTTGIYIGIPSSGMANHQGAKATSNIPLEYHSIYSAKNLRSVDLNWILQGRIRGDLGNKFGGETKYYGILMKTKNKKIIEKIKIKGVGRVTGTVKSMDFCNCIDWDKDKPEYIDYSIAIDHCLEKPQGKCVDGSEYKLYYLEPSKIQIVRRYL